MGEDAELEELRRRRALELQQRMTQDQQADAERKLEIQKQALLRRILTQEARQRLTNLKMVKPEF
ncbi:MAG: DNA-binding protein, partial [Candidatus Bathyarchaeia archaeon]